MFDRIQKNRKKKKEFEPKKLHIIPILILIFFLVGSLRFSLISQKVLMNSYMLASKLREATVQLDSTYDTIVDHGIEDRTWIHELFLGYQKNEDNSILGITIKNGDKIIFTSGERMPEMENLYYYDTKIEYNSLDPKTYQAASEKYQMMTYIDTVNPVYLTKINNNWLIRGMEQDFDKDFAVSPLSLDEKKQVDSFFTFTGFSDKTNKTRGYQDFWICYENQGNQVYIGCSVPLTDNDFLIVYVFSIGFTIAIQIITLVMVILLIRVFTSQHKVFKAYFTDRETNGKNWYYFVNKSKRKLKRFKLRNEEVSVVHFSMDRYQTFISYNGEEEARSMVFQMYQIMSENLPKDCFFARHDRAEFGILIGERDEIQVRSIVQQLIEQLEQIQTDTSVHFHAGIYKVDFSVCKDITEAFYYAGIAASQTETEKVQILYFTQKMMDSVLWDKKMENDFEQAIANHEFEVYLQPKYSVETKTPVAAEALVRWNHPKEGFLTPYKFIPIFEKEGLILKLDDYMISEVARIQSERLKQGKTMIPISVNVSRMHFGDENLAEHIKELVDAYEVPREWIELELTESAFLDDKNLIISTAHKLKEMGFFISLDDFGSGYSSLNSLREIPIDIVKLDAGFFRGSEMDDKGKIIIKEIIMLSKLLDISVVAEGIETEEQVDFLADLKCDQIQGYFFAKPMPLSEFELHISEAETTSHEE